MSGYFFLVLLAAIASRETEAKPDLEAILDDGKPIHVPYSTEKNQPKCVSYRPSKKEDGGKNDYNLPRKAVYDEGETNETIPANLEANLVGDHNSMVLKKDDDGRKHIFVELIYNSTQKECIVLVFNPSEGKFGSKGPWCETWMTRSGVPPEGCIERLKKTPCSDSEVYQPTQMSCGSTL